MKNKDKKHINYFNFIMIAAIGCSAVFYWLVRTLSGHDTPSGRDTINLYASSYFGYYALFMFMTALCFMLSVIMNKNKSDKFLMLLPPAFFASLGMMRITSETVITNKEADYFTAAGFLIFLITITLMCLLHFSPIGIAGIIGGTLYNPCFALCYAPFIAITAFFIKWNKTDRVFRILNVLTATGMIIYGILKITEHSRLNEYVVEFRGFRKEYWLVLPLIILLIWLIIKTVKDADKGKKAYGAAVSGLLPLIPVILHMFTDCYSTSPMAVAAAVSITATVFFAVTCMTDTEIFDGTINKLKKNPAVYIIILAYILHTSAFIYTSMGEIRTYR